MARLGIQTTFICLAVVTLICMIEKFPNTNAKALVRGVEEENSLIYGVDISFPMHHGKVSTNYPWLPHNIDPENNPVPEEYKDMPIQPLGNRQKFYDDFVEGCRDYFQDLWEMCDGTEVERSAYNLQQTQYMKNFTDTGFTKIRTPEKAFNAIKEFWEKHKHDEVPEGSENTYLNFWDSPTYMVNFEDERFYEEGVKIKEEVWDAASDVIQEWIGQELKRFALYGIRVYKEGSVLVPHVDQLPRVASAIINVAQDVDEDWPIEMIGHDGRAYNVTMQPGDMVLYESHSSIHGRPFALKGRYYANAFIHFEPKANLDDSDGRNSNSEELPDYIIGGPWHRNSAGELELEYDVDKEFEKIDFGIQYEDETDGDETDDYYDDEEADGDYDETDEYYYDEADYDDEYEEYYETDEFALGSTEAHVAAAYGDLETLSEIAAEDIEMLHARDENGWQPIHEAVKAGHENVVELLIKYGASVNELSFDGHSGGSPLYWAMVYYDEDNPIVTFLKNRGAVYIEPETEL